MTPTMTQGHFSGHFSRKMSPISAPDISAGHFPVHPGHGLAQQGCAISTPFSRINAQENARAPFRAHLSLPMARQCPGSKENP